MSKEPSSSRSIVTLTIDPKLSKKDRAIKEVENSKRHGIHDNKAYLYPGELIKDGHIHVQIDTQKLSTTKCPQCGEDSLVTEHTTIQKNKEKPIEDPKHCGKCGYWSFIKVST